MRMKSFKEKVLRENHQQQNGLVHRYAQQKVCAKSPEPQIRFTRKQKLINKQNDQPNMPQTQRYNNEQNTFGAAKEMLRKSVDQMKLHLRTGQTQNDHKPLKQSMTAKSFYNFSKKNVKQNFLSKSNNFQKLSTINQKNEEAGAFRQKQANERTFFKTKTQQSQQETKEYELNFTGPIIQDCEYIKSEYENSSQNDEQKLNYAKCYLRPNLKTNLNKPSQNILIHQSLNYEDYRPISFGNSQMTQSYSPNTQKNQEQQNVNKMKLKLDARTYITDREEEKRLKNQIFQKIIMTSKAEMMRSCEYQRPNHALLCIHHQDKRAKYRLIAKLQSDEQQSFYCSKCAVNLAKQGFDIEQITPMDKQMIMSKKEQFHNTLHSSLQFKTQKSKRQEEFYTFQNRLENLQSKIQKKLKQFTEKSQEMIMMDKKISITITNYNELIQILKDMKQKEVDKEERQRKQKTLDINLKRNQLSVILNNIKDTSYQISNERNKLMALKPHDFNYMFTSYMNRISSYEEYLINLEQNQLTTDIETFDSNLALEEIDEDLLIQNIFDEMYQKLTNPKLQAIQKGENADKKYLTLSFLKRCSPSVGSQLESGGSSMFYCNEQEVQQERPPFRILFGNIENQNKKHKKENKQLQKQMQFQLRRSNQILPLSCLKSVQANRYGHVAN